MLALLIGFMALVGLGGAFGDSVQAALDGGLNFGLILTGVYLLTR